MGCVYKATNRVNGRSYIGKTIGTLRNRQYQHKCDAKNRPETYFHNAICRHGLEAFDWSVLYESDDPSKLSEIEMVFIALLNTKKPNGYNLSDGGEGRIGVEVGLETRAKISAIMKSRKGRHHTEQFKRELAQRNRDRVWRQESKDKIGAKNKAKVPTPEMIARMSAARKGKKMMLRQRQKSAAVGWETRQLKAESARKKSRES